MLSQTLLQKKTQAVTLKSRPVSHHQWRQPETLFQKRESRFSGIAWSLMVVLLTLITSACNSPTPFMQPTELAETATQVPPTGTEHIPAPSDTPLPTDTPEPTSEETATPSPSPTASPTLPANNVTGRICFPGDDIPEMTLYFEETNNETLVEIPVAAGQSTYETDLPSGMYIAYAWLKDFSRGGLYSRAVPCGLESGCDDHSLLTFTVERVTVTRGIDVCDWFAGPFNVPYPPGIERTELTGSISGDIVYIEGQEPPRLRIVAFNQETDYWYWLFTQPGQTSYTLTDLPPGTYHLVAYDNDGRAGGHADANNNLISVRVDSGQAVPGVDINNWEAPRDAFPPDPTRE